MSTLPTAAELLALEPLGDDRFRAHDNLEGWQGTIFGGQPLAQAIAAAAHTAPDWPAHTLSAHFLRSGDFARPVDYQVERLRDGRRFASRRVRASQDGRTILELLAAFHHGEDGPARQTHAAPAVPPPEALSDVAALARAGADHLPAAFVAQHQLTFPVEIRLAAPAELTHRPLAEPRRAYWLRFPSALSVAPAAAYQALLACMSDFWLAGTSAAALDLPADATMAVLTLNHSLWFHRPARADDWLLYDTTSPHAGDGRGLVHGAFYDRAGRLVASSVQETSLRVR